MKSHSILSILSSVLLVSANPLVIKRQTTPGACRPAQHNIFVDDKDSGSLLDLKVVGSFLQATFAPISGQVYTSVNVNIGSVPGSNDPSTFNCNRFCSLANGGA